MATVIARFPVETLMPSTRRLLIATPMSGASLQLVRLFTGLFFVVGALACGDGGPTGVDGGDRTDDLVCDLDRNLLVSETSPGAIPAMTEPPMVTQGEPGALYLNDEDRVLGVVVNGSARAYPHAVLDHHEVINDEIDGEWFTVTFCPLTGSGLRLDPNLGAERLDVATLIEDVTIPGGTYSQLRLVIPDACIGIEQEGGGEMIYATAGFEDCGTPDGNLQTPSFDTSGLKINLPGGALEVDGDAHILLLDFDVSESFGQQAGNSGMWVMNPVIRAEDVSLTSSILVQLTAAEGVDLAELNSSLADFEATLDTETEAVAFTDLDENGIYTARFIFLLPDADYEVAVGLQEGVAPYEFTLDPTSPQTVSLGSGTQATVSFEVTSASPGS